ncbi:MAG: SBBP repeat-containing protein [Dehalococcoidia bacterium]
MTRPRCFLSAGIAVILVLTACGAPRPTATPTPTITPIRIPTPTPTLAPAPRTTPTATYRVVVIWVRQFGSAVDDGAWAVAVDQVGNVYVAGSTQGAMEGQTALGEADAFLGKYEPGGEELWTRQFGSSGLDIVPSVAIDGQGNVYVAGHTAASLPGQLSAGGGDAFLRKYDPLGQKLWTRQFGSPRLDKASALAVDFEGNVYVVGETEGALKGHTSSGRVDAFLRKYNPEGLELWTRQFGSANADAASSIALDQQLNIYVAGFTEGALPGQVNAGLVDAFLAKYDSQGREVWTRQFGSRHLDLASGVAVDLEGNIFVAGGTLGVLDGQTTAGEGDAFVRRYNASGDELWTRQFGSPASDVASSAAIDDEGNIYAAGMTLGGLPGNETAGESDAFLRKYSPEGAELLTWQFGSVADDMARSVTVGAGGTVYLAGVTLGNLLDQFSLGGADAFLVRVRE